MQLNKDHGGPSPTRYLPSIHTTTNWKLFLKDKDRRSNSAQFVLCSSRFERRERASEKERTRARERAEREGGERERERVVRSRVLEKSQRLIAQG